MGRLRRARCALHRSWERFYIAAYRRSRRQPQNSVSLFDRGKATWPRQNRKILQDGQRRTSVTIGFVHEFGPLRKTEVLEVLKTSWRPNGVDLPPGAFTEDGLAAIVRTVSGNFRLLHRLLTQIARVMEINEIDRVTAQVVDAARESLVIGVCA